MDGCQLNGYTISSLYEPNSSAELKLDVMFMKHYAPNSCLYIKVAKLRTGVGFAEMSHQKNLKLTAVIVFKIS